MKTVLVLTCSEDKNEQVSLRAHGCLLRAAAHYQHQSTSQKATVGKGKAHRCRAPPMILYPFILVSDAEAEEGEGKPLFGSLCSLLRTKVFGLSVGSPGCTRKSTDTVTFCVINTGLFFPVNAFVFLACTISCCLLNRLLSFWTEEEAKPKFK